MKIQKILTLCALLTVLLCGATQAMELQSMTGSGQCGENITWNLDSAGKLTITGTGDFYDENSEDYLPWRYLGRYIVNVNISGGISYVPDYAFRECDYLESVTLGKDVKSIGEQAFRECTSLTDVSGCDALESIKEAAFADCIALKTVDLRNVSEINFGAFYDCQSLQDVQFSDTIETIRERTFEQTGITSIVIPDNVKEIEEGAFRDCENLENIEIGSGLIYIDRIFENCKSLKTVIIPVTVTAIDQNAFNNDISDLYYAGTAAQWNKIRGGGADNLTYLAWRIHFESTGPENAAPMRFQIKDIFFEEERVRFSINTTLNGTQILRFIVSYYDESGRFIDCDNNNVFLPRDAGEWNQWAGYINVEKAYTAKIIFLDENLRVITSVSGTVKHWS